MASQVKVWTRASFNDYDTLTLIPINPQVGFPTTMSQIESPTSTVRSITSACEFCVEFRTPESSRFFKIYGPQQGHRFVASHGPYVAMPTIGQVFSGSLLVLPVEHWECFSELPNEDLEELQAFLDRLMQSSLDGISHNVVMFEHGARSTSLGGCGIYHAHIHIVPVPGKVVWQEVLPEGLTMPAFIPAIRQVRGSAEYLVFRDTQGQIAYVESPENLRYGSQYFRRVLAQHFGVSRPWDWRTYAEPEKSLVETILHFEDSDVS